MPKYKISLIEPPRVKSVWRRGTRETIIGSVRQQTPLHSQPIIAGKLRETLGDDYRVDIVDFRLRSPCGEDLYKEMPYGDGTLEHYRVGLSLESETFRDVARQSDILGLTVNFTQTAGVAQTIALRAKKLNPRLKVIFGGSDVRARPEHYLRRAGGDAIVMGDGERSGPRVVRALLGQESLADIPAVTFLDGETLRRGPYPTIDRVPMAEVAQPAFDLVAAELPHWVESHEGPLPPGVEPPLAYVETSRGCHETCPFCYTAGVKYRFMTSEQIESYAQHLKAWGFRSLMMIADNELTPLLIKKVKGSSVSGRELLLERYRIFRELGFSWEFSNGLQYSMFFADGRLDEKLIDAMFSNCYRLFTPVEDPLDLAYEKLFGSPAERRRALKSADEAFYDHHVRVLARIAATGLPMMTFGLIFGWPGDTVERVRRVADRCKVLKKAIREASRDCRLFFTPFIGIPIPGTRNWVDYRKRGLIQEDVTTHPEAWQFALTTYGNVEMVEERLRMIAELNGAEALAYWTSTGSYPVPSV